VLLQKKLETYRGESRVSSFVVELTRVTSEGGQPSRRISFPTTGGRLDDPAQVGCQYSIMKRLRRLLGPGVFMVAWQSRLIRYGI